MIATNPISMYAAPFGLSSVKLFNEIFHCTEVFGLEKTIEILYTARAEALRLEDENTTAVLSIVCREFGLTIHELISGRGRKNDRVMAIGLCVYFLKNEFNYSPTDISSALRRDRSICWRYWKKVTELNEKNIADVRFLEIKGRCNGEVGRFKMGKVQVH